MNDKKYDFIWVDDEHEDLQSTKTRAKLSGITLHAFKSVNAGIGELEKNAHLYDGVLLDARMFEDEDDSKGTEDDSNVHRAKERILQIPKKFEIFILTGQTDLQGDSSFGKAFRNIYKKGEDTDVLFEAMKAAADKQPDTQIRHHYSRVFALCTSEFLGEENAPRLLDLITQSKGDTTIHIEDGFVGMRKTLEVLFQRLNTLGLIPDELFENHGWFNPCSDFLTGKESAYKVNDGLIHPVVQLLLRQLKEVTQDAEHSLPQRLRLKVDEFIGVNKTSYLFESSLLQLFDVLLWFKDFTERNKGEIIYTSSMREIDFTGIVQRDAKGIYHCDTYIINYSEVKYKKIALGDSIRITHVVKNRKENSMYDERVLKYRKI